ARRSRPAHARPRRDGLDMPRLAFVLVERRQTDGVAFVEFLRKALGIEIELAGRHRLVGRRLRDLSLAWCRGGRAGFVVVAHEARTLDGCFAYRMVRYDTEAVQVVERRFQPIVEQRQPVFHAGITPALGD